MTRSGRPALPGRGSGESGGAEQVHRDRLRGGRGEKRFDVAREDVGFDVHAVAGTAFGKRRFAPRGRNDVHFEQAGRRNGAHDEAHAVERDGALVDDVAGFRSVEPEPQPPVAVGRFDGFEPGEGASVEDAEIDE